MQKYFEVESLGLCYEASYIGHCLQRDLIQAGYYCDVISPGSIPRKGSKSIKTDRIDALDLAQFYANDRLTVCLTDGVRIHSRHIRHFDNYLVELF